MRRDKKCVGSSSSTRRSIIGDATRRLGLDLATKQAQSRRNLSTKGRGASGEQARQKKRQWNSSALFLLTLWGHLTVPTVAQELQVHASTIAATTSIEASGTRVDRHQCASEHALVLGDCPVDLHFSMRLCCCTAFSPDRRRISPIWIPVNQIIFSHLFYLRHPEETQKLRERRLNHSSRLQDSSDRADASRRAEPDARSYVGHINLVARYMVPLRTKIPFRSIG